MPTTSSHHLATSPPHPHPNLNRTHPTTHTPYHLHHAHIQTLPLPFSALEEDAGTAVSTLNGAVLKGKTLRVEIAKPRLTKEDKKARKLEPAPEYKKKGKKAKARAAAAERAAAAASGETKGEEGEEGAEGGSAAGAAGGAAAVDPAEPLAFYHKDVINTVVLWGFSESITDKDIYAAARGLGKVKSILYPVPDSVLEATCWVKVAHVIYKSKHAAKVAAGKVRLRSPRHTMMCHTRGGGR